MSRIDILRNWLFDPGNSDQELEGKRRFVKTANVGPVTRLDVLGISNGKLKKKAAEVFRENKNASFQQVLELTEELFCNAQHIEEQILATYLLEKYKKLVSNHAPQMFERIDTVWIEHVDHWMGADHLAINVFRYLPVYEETYVAKIRTWVESPNFWRQRLSIIAFIKHIKTHPAIHNIIIDHINQLKTSKNYYVRKTFPWILREISKTNPDIINQYLLDNYMFFSKTELREATKNLANSSKIISLYESSKKQKQ